METALVWIGLFTLAWLAVALDTAVSVRLPRPAGAALLTLVPLLLAFCFLPVGGLVVAAALFSQVEVKGAWWILLAPCLLFSAGAAALIVRGRTSEAPGLPPRAAAWSPVRLAALLAVVLVVVATSARNALLSAQQGLETRRNTLLGLERVWWPGVPAALNAAPLYAQAYQKLVPLDRLSQDTSKSHDAFDSLWRDQEVDPKKLASPLLLEWTQRNEAALGLAQQAAAMPGYATIEETLWRASRFHSGREAKVFQLELSRPGHDPQQVDNLVSRRRVADLLQTRALQRAFAGQTALAVQDANAALSLAAQTGGAMAGPGRMLERLLQAPGFDEAATTALRLPRDDGLVAHLQRTLLRSERDSLDGATLFTTGKMSGKDRDPLDLPFLIGIGVLRGDALGAQIERRFDALWEGIYQPPAQRLPALRQTLAKVDPFFEPVRAEWLTAALESDLRNAALRASAEAGLAAARYRRLHGAWPASLEALVPALLAGVPQDPFDGAPLRYKAGPEAALVYSVGSDLKDDGGKPVPEGAEKPEGDLVFRVAAPR